ncbi:MAG: thiamine-phosphate kinase [Proteobacteria bacterium]|nr:thiamine-phosphate kinase [Pseudomonadota bacterium]
MAEFALIDLIRKRCAILRADVALGIGDDAALLAVPSGQLLAVSTDTLVAGVHFLHGADARDVGWKSLAVNLSDMAATGAEPAWATLALTLPGADARWVEPFADGFADLARLHRVALVGGDTTQGPLSITVTIHGFVAEGAALTRSGARAGDGVYVTGTLGDAAAGLRMVLSKQAGNAHLLERLHRPTPRVAQGLVLRGRATACIDVSDGLVADLGHICTASRVGAAIDADALPASPALLAAFDIPDRRELQLAGGDDYELCFTAPDEVAPGLLRELHDSGCAATRIGRVVAGSGVRVRDASGNPVAIAHRGWEHFA